MTFSGNKGEWSEVYALFKLLADGIVYAGDDKMKRIDALYYPIIEALRKETSYDLIFRRGDVSVSLSIDGEDAFEEISVDEFITHSKLLLEDIKSHQGAFTLPDTEVFLERLRCTSLKAKSMDKADIRLIIHDPRTKINSLMGYSIKSQLGNPATLLNASQATNWTFRIEGCPLSSRQVEEINSITTKQKILDRVSALKELGADMVFVRVEHSVFSHNLRMLDGDLPLIIAHLLLLQTSLRTSSLLELVDALARLNPLCCEEDFARDYYTYKVKHLLVATALGMVPAKPWTGRYDVNGGYLVVKEDGDVLCYHFYDRNRVEDYLLSNAYLERSSTTRHDYGYIEEKNGDFLFRLNLQIRLK